MYHSISDSIHSIETTSNFVSERCLSFDGCYAYKLKREKNRKRQKLVQNTNFRRWTKVDSIRRRALRRHAAPLAKFDRRSNRRRQARKGKENYFEEKLGKTSRNDVRTRCSQPASLQPACSQPASQCTETTGASLFPLASSLPCGSRRRCGPLSRMFSTSPFFPRFLSK